MKKILKFLKKPPIWFMMLALFIFIISLTITIICLVKETNNFLSYTMYAVSAISLSYCIYTIIIFIPIIKHKYNELCLKNKKLEILTKNSNVRVSITTTISTIINIIYCIMLSISAILSHSVWVACLAGYYFILISTKLVVLLTGLNIIKHKQENSQTRKVKLYRNIGILLIILALAMSSMIIQMITMEADISYENLLIYAVALYTFYKLISSIVFAIKNKSKKNYIVQCIRNINLVTSVVSLFSLQVALIKTFSNGENMSAMNIMTGVCVSFFIIILGVIIIINEKKKIKKELYLNENQ